MKFLLFLSFVSAFQVISKFDINAEMVQTLLKYGPVAKISYNVQNLIKDPFTVQLFKDEEEDLGLKIWVQVNICKEEPEKQLITVVRLDNVDDNREKILNTKKRIGIDHYWREWRGWPNDLVININNETNIIVPPNPDCDSMQITVEGHKFSFEKDGFDIDIPAIIHQITGQNMKVVDKLILLMKMKNQHWDHRQYSLDEMGPFIEKEEGRRVRRAFDTIIPKAYKADILRLVLLKKFGGIYLDSKLCPLMPFYEFMPKEGNFLVRDLNDGIFNGFMAFRIGDPFLKRYLDQIVMNIENRYYGETPLSITGPMLLKEIFDSWEDKDSFTITTELEFEYHYFRKDGKKVCIYYNSQYRNNQLFEANDRYKQKWLNTKVYGEERNL